MKFKSAHQVLACLTGFLTGATGAHPPGNSPSSWQPIFNEVTLGIFDFTNFNGT